MICERFATLLRNWPRSRAGSGPFPQRIDD